MGMVVQPAQVIIQKADGSRGLGIGFTYNFNGDPANNLQVAGLTLQGSEIDINPLSFQGAAEFGAPRSIKFFWTVFNASAPGFNSDLLIGIDSARDYTRIFVPYDTAADYGAQGETVSGVFPVRANASSQIRFVATSNSGGSPQGLLVATIYNFDLPPVSFSY